MSSSRPKLLYVSGSGSGNTLRYRVRYAEELLRSTGVSTAAVHFTDPQLVAWAREADAIVLYRTPANRRVLRLVQEVRSTLRLPLAFDIDDRVFLPQHVDTVPFLQDLAPRQRELFVADAERRGRIVPFVDSATGTTTPVVEDLATLTSSPTAVLPNGLTATALRHAGSARRRDPDGRIRIGYFSGSATHDEDWAVAEPAVVDLLRREPHVELWLVGPLRPSAALTAVEDRVRLVAPVPWQELPALLAQVDVNLAPLDLTPFTEGKSAIKWLEAAVVGTPTIATATRPFLEATSPDEVLLVPGGGDWSEALAELVDDAADRAALGERAREGALRDFGPAVQADRYRAWLDGLLLAGSTDIDLAPLRGLISAAPRPRSLGISLEPYAFPATGPGGEVAPPRGAAVLDSARRTTVLAARQARRYVRGARRRIVPARS